MTLGWELLQEDKLAPYFLGNEALPVDIKAECLRRDKIVSSLITEAQKKLAGLKLAVAAATLELNGLQKTRARNRSLLSPIRNIPPEILSIILVHSHSLGCPKLLKSCDVTLLSLVCRNGGTSYSPLRKSGATCGSVQASVRMGLPQRLR